MDKITIHVKDRWTEKPVNQRILGHFIEAGFGRQVNGLWAEMVYNRAFRPVEPYKIATWEWLGLDQAHYTPEAHFWHSGYEEFDWEAVGNIERGYTCGTHTFKGTTSHWVTNRGENEVCGLSQKGIHLQKGRSYTVRLMAGVQGDVSLAGLNGFGDTIHSEKSHPLSIRLSSEDGEEYTYTYSYSCSLTTVQKEFVWQFEAKETETLSLSLTFDWPGTVMLSYISMMPDDNIDGFRADVVEVLRQVKPPVVRFPGGCFVSFYNWESSIGPRNEREPQTSFYWGGLEENDVGLDEFMALSKAVGFEPQICFNMMSSTPFKARQMVEYLNAPDTGGMGRLRMLNGHREGYGVRLFEMDNEPGRKWTAEQYARQCVAFAGEMRQADPKIEMMMACYAYPKETLPQMLDIAGKSINYVIYRDGRPEFVQKVLPVIKAYNEKNGTEIKLVNTEWLPDCRSIEPFEDREIPTDYRWQGKITNNYKDIFSTQQISWNYALNGAHRILDYISYGGEFGLANFNNCCNTWGQNIIESTKESCFLSCAGEMFAFFGRHFSPCKADVTETGDERVRAQLVETDSGLRQLFLINHSGSDLEVRLPGGKWMVSDGIRADKRMAKNTQEKNEVHPCRPSIEGEVLVLPSLSLVVLSQQ